MKLILILISFTTLPQISFAAIVGKFFIVTGKVTVISDRKVVTAAKVGTSVSVNDTVATESNSKARIVMFDRNIINIAPSTKFIITNYNYKTDKNVSINLNSGKIRTEVLQKYDGNNNKFEIRTSTAVAGVRGTKFITSFNINNRTTSVTTLEGHVELSSLRNISNKEIVNVYASQQAEVSENSSPSEPITLDSDKLNQLQNETEANSNSEKNNDADNANLLPTEDNKRSQTIIDNVISERYKKTKVIVKPVGP